MESGHADLTERRLSGRQIRSRLPARGHSKRSSASKGHVDRPVVIVIEIRNRNRIGFNVRDLSITRTITITRSRWGPDYASRHRDFPATADFVRKQHHLRPYRGLGFSGGSEIPGPRPGAKESPPSTPGCGFPCREETGCAGGGESGRRRSSGRRFRP